MDKKCPCKVGGMYLYHQEGSVRSPEHLLSSVLDTHNCTPRSLPLGLEEANRHWSNLLSLVLESSLVPNELIQKNQLFYVYRCLICATPHLKTPAGVILSHYIFEGWLLQKQQDVARGLSGLLPAWTKPRTSHMPGLCSVS